MSSPLHAQFFADHAVQQRVAIVENVQLAKDTYRVRLDCPQIADRVVPGQFAMLRLAGCNDPLIGRPLAMYDVVGSQVDFVHLAKGKFTTRLAELGAGAKLDVWGPLGNGFSRDPVEHLIMVAGGIGQTPFLALGKQFLGRQIFGMSRQEFQAAKRVTLLYGVRTADYLAGADTFCKAGIELKIASDDGSAGHHGLVTDLLREMLLTEDRHAVRIAACGPELMMEAVARLTAQQQVCCEVSLETPMACGIGICFTCVAKVRDEQGDWDYKRTCVEGPVFDSCAIEW